MPKLPAAVFAALALAQLAFCAPGRLSLSMSEKLYSFPSSSSHRYTQVFK